jgi:hypothetical protein
VFPILFIFHLLTSFLSEKDYQAITTRIAQELKNWTLEECCESNRKEVAEEQAHVRVAVKRQWAKALISANIHYNFDDW